MSACVRVCTCVINVCVCVMGLKDMKDGGYLANRDVDSQTALASFLVL